MYKLRYTPAVEAVWDSLRGEARAELDEALRHLIEDPRDGAQPHPDDPDVKFILTLKHTAVVFVIFETPTIKRIRLLGIEPL